MKQSSILIVDDNDLIRIAIERMLLDRHYTTVAVQNGREALDYCRSHTIKLIITDMNMPIKNGLELIRDLKKEKPDLPIIAMSGVRFELQKARAEGAADILLKPFSGTELIQVLQKVLPDS